MGYQLFPIGRPFLKTARRSVKLSGKFCSSLHVLRVIDIQTTPIRMKCYPNWKLHLVIGEKLSSIRRVFRGQQHPVTEAGVS